MGKSAETNTAFNIVKPVGQAWDIEEILFRFFARDTKQYMIGFIFHKNIIDEIRAENYLFHRPLRSVLPLFRQSGYGCNLAKATLDHGRFNNPVLQVVCDNISRQQSVDIINRL